MTADLVPHPSLTPLSALTAIWFLGATVVAVGIAREWRSARRHKDAVLLDAALYPELAADFAALCRRFGLDRPVTLLVASGNDRPHVYGVIRSQQDGKRIYFTRAFPRDDKQADNSQICAINADGSKLTALTKGDAPDYLGSAPGTFLMATWMDRITKMK